MTEINEFNNTPINNNKQNPTLDRWHNFFNLIFDLIEAIINRLKSFFITGVILLVPSVVTIYIMFQLFLIADGLLGNFVAKIVGYRIPGFGIFVTVTLFVLAGAIGQNVIGKRLYSWLEFSLQNLPLVRSIYNSIKQISDVVFQQKSADFKRVVFVEYPKDHVYMLGFITSDEAKWYQNIAEMNNKQYVSVFIPTTPNPTSGFLVVIEKHKVINTNLTVEGAMKIIISGGLVPIELPSYANITPDEFIIPH